MEKDAAKPPTDPLPPQPAPSPSAAPHQTDSDHQGHRNERDQSEGNMHNGELGAGLQKQP